MVSAEVMLVNYYWQLKRSILLYMFTELVVAGKASLLAIVWLTLDHVFSQTTPV